MFTQWNVAWEVIVMTAITVDVLSVCAALLGSLALALLWHCARLGAALERQRGACANERARREASEQALISTRAQLAQALARQDRIKEAERQRIGRDLHDDLGQHLLALTMEVCALASTHPRLKQPLEQIDTHLRTAIRSLRTVIKNLLPEQLNQGLRAAVESQLAQFTRLSGIRCRLDADAAAFNAAQDSQFQGMLYRILQESLSNIARHAQATQVEIALHRQNSTLNLVVRDNGVGLPPQQPAPRRRCGLDGIEQRVTAIGGQFHIASQPGEGTALSMHFPLGLALHQAGAAPATAQ
jgi:signal transduction histidine kinase